MFRSGMQACGFPGCAGCDDDPSGASCDARAGRWAAAMPPDAPPSPTQSPRGFGAAAHDRIDARREAEVTTQVRRVMCTGTTAYGKPCVLEARHAGKCQSVWTINGD